VTSILDLLDSQNPEAIVDYITALVDTVLREGAFSNGRFSAVKSRLQAQARGSSAAAASISKKRLGDKKMTRLASRGRRRRDW
jgi:hypothetical protein